MRKLPPHSSTRRSATDRIINGAALAREANESGPDSREDRGGGKTPPGLGKADAQCMYIQSMYGVHMGITYMAWPIATNHGSRIVCTGIHTYSGSPAPGVGGRGDVLARERALVGSHCNGLVIAHDLFRVHVHPAGVFFFLGEGDLSLSAVRAIFFFLIFLSRSLKYIYEIKKRGLGCFFFFFYLNYLDKKVFFFNFLILGGGWV
jgi:hypothetical protein